MKLYSYFWKPNNLLKKSMVKSFAKRIIV